MRCDQALAYREHHETGGRRTVPSGRVFELVAILPLISSFFAEPGDAGWRLFHTDTKGRGRLRLTVPAFNRMAPISIEWRADMFANSPNSGKLRAAFWLAGLFSLCLSSGARSQQIEFVEDFVLATERQSALQKLVPGTEDYFYYHSLDRQLREEYGPVEEWLKLWIEKHGVTDRVREMQLRQALLRYPSQPRASLDFIVQTLGLQFEHQRRIPPAEQQLPTSLAPELLSVERLLDRALREHPETGGLEPGGLELVAGSFEQLDRVKRRHLLARIEYPDFPRLLELIEDDLRQPDRPAFGSLPIHQQLTLEQLARLAETLPQLRNELGYVQLYCRKLLPGDDVILAAEPQEELLYQQRVYQFVQGLAPSFQSLKAAVLFRILELQRNGGVYDRAAFLEYLKLPRRQGHLNPLIWEKLSDASQLADLGADFSSITRRAPIVDELPLVRDYLEYFLARAESPAAFAPYFEEQFLRREFAIARILSGQGDPQRWAAVLSPEEYKALLERVEIGFVPGNPERVAVADLVRLRLQLKNVPRLLVKIYEINTENFYQHNWREIGTDLNLDGLVPNWELAFDYSEPPAQRVLREFEFPQLDHRGVFVIDLIGAGTSSRALVRKGDLTFVQQIRPQGHELTILDETGTVCPQADVWLQGRRFLADAEGVIRIPFSTQPGPQPLLLRNGDFSTLASLDHRAENYELGGGLQVDRESLLKLRSASILIRPSLRVTGTPIPIGNRLEDVQLKVTTTNQDGQAGTQTFANLKLDEQGETTCEMQVPPRLATLRLELIGRIRVASRNKDETLTLIREISLNQIDRSDEIVDVHLLRSGPLAFLEVRGLSGETRGRIAVQLEIKHRQFTQPVNATVQSNADGVIELGALPDVDWLRATISGGTTRSWELNRLNFQTSSGSLHGLANQPQQLLVPPSVKVLADLAFFEMRSGLIAAERTAELELSNEVLSIPGLSAGDYLLVFKPTRERLTIRVTAGEEVAGVFRGRQRSLESRDQTVLRISELMISDEAVELRLDSSSPLTRVHLFASRFVPRFSAGRELGRVRDLEPAVYLHPNRGNAYLAGRELGEEYQYILMRQLARRFPGLQLARPSLLLNPWSLGPTDNRERLLTEGGVFGNAAEAAPGAESREAGQAASGGESTDYSNLDFLEAGTIVLANLRPDAEGRIAVPRGQLGEKQYLVVVVADLFQTIERTIALPAKAAEVRDLRMVKAFDPQQQLSLQQATTPLKQGEQFEVGDLLTAKYSLYDDLGDVFSLLSALAGDSVEELRFLTRWRQLPEPEKKSLYSRHACHELHLFLWHQDPEFFRVQVRPFLENKLEKTFFDRWLLEEPLEGYLEPWRFARLNAFEQVLLARRLPSSRAAILRRMQDQRLAAPPDRAALNRLFEAALVGNPDGIRPEDVLRVEELRRTKSSLGAAQIFAGPDPSNQPLGGGGGGRGGFAANAPGAPPAAARPEAAGKVLAVAPGAQEAEEAKKVLGELRDAAAGEVLAARDLDRKDGGESRAKEKADVARRQSRQGEQFKDKFFGRFVDEAEPESRFYERIRPTEEWVESNYYRLNPNGPQPRDLLPLNDFWIDWLRADPEAPFTSPNFPQLLIFGKDRVEQARSATILALALLDLPFDEPEHAVEYKEGGVHWQLAGPAIMFHQQIRPARKAEQGTPLLVSENFFQKNNRYRMEGGLQLDRFLTGKFSIQQLYGAQIVVTNPTSTPRVVQLVYQIPAGAIATSGSQETRTLPLQLNAFSSQSFEYHFYFPAAGRFKHFPAQVAAGEELLAAAQPFDFEVVDEPPPSDLQSWDYLSQNGTSAEVLAFLGRANLMEINLGEIAFRMRDLDFFRQVTGLLRERQVFDPVLWSYAVQHNELRELREYLGQSEALLQRCGAFLQSELVQVEPHERGWYEQREYWPLVHSRTHAVGNRREILNPSIHRQYHRLLRNLSYRSRLTSEDHLALVYYLLLQDRWDEALRRFALVQPGELKSQLQYDYCQAYLQLLTGQVEAAALIAERYREYPVEHWQQRFGIMREQLAEIRGGVAAVVNPDDPAQVQAAAASEAESFQFKVADGKLELEYRNLERLTLNLYAMDVELSFSRKPFAAEAEDGFAMIRPNVSQPIKLEAKSGRQTIALPEAYRSRNVLVELRSGEQTQSEAIYANNLNVQFREAFGDLQVSNCQTGAFLPQTYVKVYGQRADGSVVFVKDGYTDLRGRFDYLTQSNVALDGVQKLAVLVLNSEQGTLIRTVGMPRE